MFTFLRFFIHLLENNPSAAYSLLIGLGFLTVSPYAIAGWRSQLFQTFLNVCRQDYPAFSQWFGHYRSVAVQHLAQGREWKLADAVLSFFVLLGLLCLLPIALVVGAVLWLQGVSHYTSAQNQLDPTLRIPTTPNLSFSQRKYLIRAANTPVELLLKLGQEFPRELLNNPHFKQLLLENPQFLATMPTPTLNSILVLEDIPIGYLDQAATNPNIDLSTAKIIAKHPNASRYALENVALHSRNADVGRSLLQRPMLFFPMLCIIAEHGQGDTIAQLLQRGSSPEILQKIAQRPQIVQYLVTHAKLADHVLDYLAHHIHPKAQMSLVYNATTPTRLLAKLATIGTAEVQLCLFRRGNLPEAVIEKLAEHGTRRIQKQLAQRKHLSESVIERLAEHGNAETLRYLMHHPNVSESILEAVLTKLANHRRLSHRKFVVWHPQISSTLLQQLSQDSNGEVAAIATHKYELLTNHPAANPNTSPDQLERFSREGVDLMRLVARNSNTRSELLQQLANSPDPCTRAGVASNPNISERLLLQLGIEFPQQMLDNPLFSLLLMEQPNFIQNLPRHQLEGFVKQPDTPLLLRIECAIHLGDRTTLTALANQLSTDLEAPFEALKKLVYCPFPEIAEQAKLHINWAREMEDWEAFFTQQMVQLVLDSRANLSDYYDVLSQLNYIPDSLLIRAASSQETKLRLFAKQYLNPQISTTLPKHLADDINAGDTKAIQGSHTSSTSNLIPDVLCWQTSVLWLLSAVFTKGFTALLILIKAIFAKAYRIIRPYFEHIVFFIFTLIYWIIVASMFGLGLFGVFLLFFALIMLAVDLLGFFVFGTYAVSALTGAWYALRSLDPFHILGDSQIHQKHLQSAKVAADPTTPVRDLERISRTAKPEVRWHLLYNPELPTNLLEQLAEDTEILAIAKHLNFDIPERFLYHLLVLKGESCRRAIKQYLSHSHPYIREWVLQGYAKADALIVRLIVLLHPTMPQTVLVEKANSVVWLERCAIAQNPSTPNSILHQLAQDPNRVVQAAAKANLAR